MYINIESKAKVIHKLLLTRFWELWISLVLVLITLPIGMVRYPALRLAREVMAVRGLAGAAFNTD